MSGRSVPHAHPATAEYEFANPSRLGEQRFGEEFCRTYVLPADVDPWRVRAALSHDGILNLEAPRGGRHLDTEINEVYISLLPAPPDPDEEEEAARLEP
ncbi:heat shock protein beta-2 isoform 2-T2 [Rhynchocyon petersi]